MEKTIQPIEYQEKRVLTTDLVGDYFEVDSKKIRQNFNNNQTRYEKGKHYFVVPYNDPCLSKISTNALEAALRPRYLWTEAGLLQHAKSLNNDRAWQTYEMLVDTYFRVKEMRANFETPKTFAEALRLAADQAELIEKQAKQLEEQAPAVAYANQIGESENLISVHSMANSLGIGEVIFYKWLRASKIMFFNDEKQNVPYQRYIDQGYCMVKTRVLEKNDKYITYNKAFFTGKGKDWISRKWNNEQTQPILLQTEPVRENQFFQPPISNQPKVISTTMQ